MVKKVVGFVLVIVLCIGGCIATSTFIIGEPVDGKQLYCEITENGDELLINGGVLDSALGLKNVRVDYEGEDAYVSVRKVLVSPLCKDGSFEAKVDIDGIKNVYVGGELVWSVLL